MGTSRDFFLLLWSPGKWSQEDAEPRPCCIPMVWGSCSAPSLLKLSPCILTAPRHSILSSPGPL